MGIVAKQASTSSIINYIGVVIGFVNVAYLMNHWFTPEELGLRSILLSIGVVVSQFAHLGTNRGLVKFFPFFSQKDSKSDNGLLSIGLLFPLIGFSVFSIGLFIFQDQVIEKFNSESDLFEAFYWAIFPITFLLLYNSIFESYLQARSETVFASLLRNVFNRLFTTVLLILFYYDVIDFYWFIIWFILSYLVNIILFVGFLIYRGEFQIPLKVSLFKGRVKRFYFAYSAYSILAGISYALINNIDSIMIGFYLGLTPTAIYSNAFLISSLIYMPADAISKISLPLLSSYWKERKLFKIAELYQKSSLTQLLIGGLLFILVWASLDNLFAFQKEEYAAGKYVLFMLGLSKVINMMFGLNSQILNITKYYKFDTITSLFLALFTVVSNYIMIPIYGIEGASFATLISILVFNVIRYFYVKDKLKIQPFSIETLKAIVILCIVFFVGVYLPRIDNIFLDTIYRSITIIIIFTIPTIYFHISEDIDSMFYKTLKRFKR